MNTHKNIVVKVGTNVFILKVDKFETQFKVLFLAVSFFVATGCQWVGVPHFSEAMGWQLESVVLDGKPYAQVTVQEEGFAQRQGFETGDLILLENYEATQSYSNGILIDPLPDGYLKALLTEVCSAGMLGAEDEVLDFEILRGDERIDLKNIEIPKMECA